MYKTRSNGEIREHSSLVEAKMDALLSFKKTNKLVEVLNENDKVVFSKGLNEAPDMFGIETPGEITKRVSDVEKQARKDREEKLKKYIDIDIVDTYLTDHTFLDNIATYDTIEARKEYIVNYIMRDLPKYRNSDTNVGRQGLWYPRPYSDGRIPPYMEYNHKPVDKKMVELFADYMCDYWKDSDDWLEGLKFNPITIKTWEDESGKWELKRVNASTRGIELFRNGKFYFRTLNPNIDFNIKKAEECIEYYKKRHNIEESIKESLKEDLEEVEYKGFKIVPVNVASIEIGDKTFEGFTKYIIMKDGKHLPDEIYDKHKLNSVEDAKKLIDKIKNIKEDLEDIISVELPPTEEQIDNAFDSVIRNELSKLFLTIDDYSADIETLRAENADEEMIKTLDLILDDLNTHVGMLQSCLNEVKA